MNEMMDWHKVELYHKEHYQDLLREGARARLVREALAGRDLNQPLFCRTLNWLGHCLEAWGRRLQQRFAANRPIQSFPVAHRPQ
jgi:hypothetical protein